MAAKIQGLIPPQNFETIREAIVLILGTELTQQLTFASDPEDIAILTALTDASGPGGIYDERTSPFEHDEIAVMIVKVNEGTYDNENADSSDGSYEYYIDIYTAIAGRDSERGDTRSKRRLERLIGMVRSILKNSNYIRLGFDPPDVDPIIQGVTISRFGILQDQNNQDAQSVTMARVVFNVRANETTEVIPPSALNNYNTEARLNETDEGFRYENVPTP